MQLIWESLLCILDENSRYANQVIIMGLRIFELVDLVLGYLSHGEDALSIADYGLWGLTKQKHTVWRSDIKL